MTRFILLLSVLLLSGCATFSLGGSDVKPVEVQTKAVDKTPLAIPAPEPLKFKKLTWIILTPENAAKILADMESRGEQPVLFGMTADSYQELSMGVGEIRNFINTQRTIIEKYKEYYEPKKEPPPEKK